MTVLSLVYAPDPIFKKKAKSVAIVDDSVRKIIDDIIDTMRYEGAIGIGANMVGVLQRIAVIDMQENGEFTPKAFINPEIIWTSEETQVFNEASLCFPHIDADITRPKAIKVSYLDYDGKPQELEQNGFIATVIQHEIDYLNGKVFLDYLSRMKRNMLLKKMQKQIKLNPPHVHGEHCQH
jgi:peptide deformylase